MSVEWVKRGKWVKEGDKLTGVL